ncbi:hypothetical protein C8J57DRAFT_1304824, partial [Mycena rebaudengoi]
MKEVVFRSREFQLNNSPMYCFTSFDYLPTDHDILRSRRVPLTRALTDNLMM